MPMISDMTVKSFYNLHYYGRAYARLEIWTVRQGSREVRAYCMENAARDGSMRAWLNSTIGFAKLLGDPIRGKSSSVVGFRVTTSMSLVFM